jgi:type VI secretion system protein ImpM
MLGMQGTAGMFGKIPAQGDFVRLNASTPAALAFDAFLQESLDGLRRTGGDLVPEPVRFAFFNAAGGGAGVCGVFSPSRDSVGRSYPLSVFVPLPSARNVASLPIVTRAFVEAAGELLALSESLPAAALANEVRNLPAVPDGAEGTEVLRRSLDDTGASWLWQAMFAEDPFGSAMYAIHTARLACDSAGARASAGTGVILDCPAPNEPAALFWLAAIEARLGAGTATPAVAPSFFWSANRGGRMLIALGRPSSSLLTFLTRPESTSNRLWPLATSVAAARQAAERDISPEVKRRVTSPDSSLLDVVDALGPAGTGGGSAG